ncbi:MAG: DNA repair protein RadC [Planctomycetota bacterium]
MKQLPESERPRERLAKLGQQHLTDAELLAIIIGGGARDITAVELARSLIVRFGGFRRLAECSTAELQKVHGIGAAKAAGIKAALEIARRFNGPPATSKPGAFLSPEAVFERYRHKLGMEKRETFVTMLLDAKNRLIRDLTISQGSLTQSIVHPREVFEPAIRDSAASVIFAHNHPSGDTTPSREDIEITKRLKQTGDVIGIRVLDHVIVSETGYTSLANEGCL